MSNWTPEQEQELLHYDRAEWSAAMIAGITGYTEDQVRNKLKRLKAKASSVASYLSVDGLKLIDYPSTVQQVSGDSAICACVHVPQTDPQMWVRYLGIIDRDSIPTAIIAGDIVTGDMFSKWDIREAYRWEAEVESLRRHLAPLAERVERVVILPGNHIANRIVRISGGHIKLQQVIDMARLPDALREKIHTTDLDYLDYTSGSEEFYVAHSASYSKMGGRVPVQYAEKYQRHIIAGNGHLHGWQTTQSGKYHGIDLGTMADSRFMGYANRTLTTFPVMQQSFVTVRSGAVRVYGSGLPVTDWDVELT